MLFILTQVAIKRTKKAYEQYYFLRLGFLLAVFLLQTGLQVLGMENPPRST